MTQVLNEIISAVLQVGILTLVPFIFFLFRKNKAIGFSGYIGLTKPTQKSVVYAIAGSLLFICSTVGIIFIDADVKQMVTSPPSVTGNLRSMGITPVSIIVWLITALFRTSLSEEIFFRGFIGKRLIGLSGFKTGNAIQSIVFGMVHLLLFLRLPHSTAGAVIFIFIMSTIGGWMTGYINERSGGGSILPGWIAHGLANCLSYFVIAFLLP
ncbi:MAG: CPBP family intramembrane glutamic endopeptidase [Bacteroidota bacterium]